MTDGQTYYDGLISQGYPADQALGYTQQYYPGFYPATAATAPMPMPAQPVAQPQAVSQPQMIQPVAQTIPMQQPMMNTATVGMAPMGMAAMPVADNKPIMAIIIIITLIIFIFSIRCKVPKSYKDNCSN